MGSLFRSKGRNMSNCNSMEYLTFRIGGMLFLGKVVVQLCDLLCAMYLLGVLLFVMRVCVLGTFLMMYFSFTPTVTW